MLLTASLPARRAFASIAFAAWLLAILLPAAYLDGGAEHGFAIMGYALLIFGPLGIAQGQLGWFANPFLLLCLTLLTRPFVSRRLWIGSAGLLLLSGASALAWRGWPDLDSDRTLPLAAYGPGYYLWLALVLGIGAAMLFLAFQEPKSE